MAASRPTYLPAGSWLPTREFHVELELRAEGPIVPTRIQTAVDFATLKHKARRLHKETKVARIIEIFHCHRNPIERDSFEYREQRERSNWREGKLIVTGRVNL